MKSQTDKITWAFFCLYEGNLTGGPKRTLDLIAAAKRNGISPLFVTNCAGKHTEIAEQQSIQVRLIDVPDSLRAAGGKGLKVNPRRWFNMQRDKRRVSRQIDNLISKEEFNGWWARGTKAVLMAAPATQRQKIPLIWDLGAEYRSRGLMCLLHLLAFNRSSKVVAQSEYVFRDTFPGWMLRRFEKKRIALIPGLSPERVARLEAAALLRGAYRRDLPLTMIGTINPRKNQLALIQAAIQLWDSGKEFTLRLVGSVTHEVYYQKCLATLTDSGHADRVEWAGWRDDIPQVLAESAAIVMCSQQEGLPQVVLEALYFGCPVISHPVGGVPSVVVDNETGFLVAEPNGNLAATLERFLNATNDQLKSIVVAAGEHVRRVASQVKWEQDYCQLLRALAEKGIG